MAVRSPAEQHQVPQGDDLRSPRGGMPGEDRAVDQDSREEFWRNANLQTTQTEWDAQPPQSETIDAAEKQDTISLLKTKCGSTERHLPEPGHDRPDAADSGHAEPEDRRAGSATRTVVSSAPSMARSRSPYPQISKLSKHVLSVLFRPPLYF